MTIAIFLSKLFSITIETDYNQLISPKKIIPSKYHVLINILIIDISSHYQCKVENKKIQIVL